MLTDLNFMSFTSVNFLIFLPIVALLYFKIPKNYKNGYLLFISYFFYIFYSVQLCFILPIMSILNFYLGKLISKSKDKKRKTAFIFSLFSNISILLIFKYYNFFADFFPESINNLVGVTLDDGSINWMMPLGISFFTFSSLSYLIDIYLKKIESEENFIDFCLFLGFFAYVTSGPISRANAILPQLKKEREFNKDNIVVGLQLMAIGYFKKLAVADILIKFISEVHSNLDEYSGIMLIFTAIIYSFWLYADFSGYSDIARGTAKILGIEIIDNFNTPYLSQNMSGFWARWHISLSSWFQDYIFMPFVWENPLKKIPIIGNFFEKPPVLIAIFLVFLTSGIWHGNTWPFVVWGVCHAVFRIGEDLLRKYYKKPDKKPKFFKFWGKTAFTFSLVTFSYIFFASKSIDNAFIYISKLFSDFSLASFINQLINSVANGFDSTPILIYAYLAFSFICIAILINMDLYRYFKLKGKCLTTIFPSMKTHTRFLCYYLLIALICAGFILNNGGFASSGNFLYQGF